VPAPSPSTGCSASSGPSRAAGGQPHAASSPGLERDRPWTGASFPDVVLPDQTGAVVDLHAARGGKRALVLFHRSAETYAWFQRIHCFAEIEIAPGFHVVGHPAADGMVPVSLDVAPLDGLELGAVTWPAPTPLRRDDLDADLPAHEWTIRGSLPVTFTAAPGAGDHRLRLTVTYQACDRIAYLPPSSITLELPIREAALVDRPLPAAPAKTP
jgi:DsbC/DsbD-like thiol-disulfide interchange protein